MKTKVGEWELVMLLRHGDGWVSSPLPDIEVEPVAPAATPWLSVQVPHGALALLQGAPQAPRFGLRRKGDEEPSIATASLAMAATLLVLGGAAPGPSGVTLRVDTRNECVQSMLADASGKSPAPFGAVSWKEILGTEPSPEALWAWVARAALLFGCDVELKQ